MPSVRRRPDIDTQLNITYVEYIWLGLRNYTIIEQLKQKRRRNILLEYSKNREYVTDFSNVVMGGKMTIDCDFILQLQEHLAIETKIFYCQSVLKGAILQFIWLLAEKNLIIYELLSYNSSMYSFSAKVIQSFLSSSIEKKTYLKVAGRNYL